MAVRKSPKQPDRHVDGAVPAAVSQPGKRPTRRVADPADLPMLRVALDEGKRLLDDQVGELDGMRQRTVQFLAFVGSATAFLVGAGLSSADKDGTFRYLAVGGALAFIVVLYFALCVLRGVTPWKLGERKASWDFRLNPGTLMVYLDYDIGQPDEAQFLDEVVKLYQSCADTNESHLVNLRRVYWSFLTLASVQLVLWVGIVSWYR